MVFITHENNFLQVVLRVDGSVVKMAQRQQMLSVESSVGHMIYTTNINSTAMVHTHVQNEEVITQDSQ